MKCSRKVSFFPTSEFVTVAPFRLPLRPLLILPFRLFQFPRLPSDCSGLKLWSGLCHLPNFVTNHVTSCRVSRQKTSQSPRTSSWILNASPLHENIWLSFCPTMNPNVRPQQISAITFVGVSVAQLNLVSKHEFSWKFAPSICSNPFGLRSWGQVNFSRNSSKRLNHNFVNAEHIVSTPLCFRPLEFDRFQLSRREVIRFHRGLAFKVIEEESSSSLQRLYGIESKNYTFPTQLVAKPNVEPHVCSRRCGVADFDDETKHIEFVRIHNIFLPLRHGSFVISHIHVPFQVWFFSDICCFNYEKHALDQSKAEQRRRLHFPDDETKSSAKVFWTRKLP